MNAHKDVTIRFIEVDGKWLPSEPINIDNEMEMFAVYELARHQMAQLPDDKVSPGSVAALGQVEGVIRSFRGIKNFEIKSIVEQPGFRSVTVGKRLRAI